MRARLVGYAVALDGEVVSVDVFDAPKLFARLDHKLRRSYYAEAIDAPVVADAQVPTAADVRAFVRQAEAAPDQPVYDTGEADTILNVGDAAASTKVMLKRARRGAKPLYKSVQKHAKKRAVAPSVLRP